MDIIDEQEFLRRNDIEANRRVLRILFCALVAGPLIALGSFFHVFETSYWFCLVVTVISLIEWLIDYRLCKNEKYCKLTKYFGLFSVAVLIGVTATQFSIGIYISYMFIPIVSCMYLDSKLTRNISMICYAIMIIALYFRAYGAIVRDFTHFTHMQWFVSQGLGYTMEFTFSSIAICTLTDYLKGIIKKYYEESIDKITFSQTDRVKSAFFMNMSTEVKDTLDEVDRLTKELFKENRLGNEEKQKIERIANANKFVSSKMKDVADFSRIDLTKKQSTVRRYHLSSLVSEVKNAILSRTEGKNIDFSVVVNPMVPNELIGDKVRIRQVLINLLSDSIIEQEDGFIILRVDYKQDGSQVILLIDVLDNSYERREEQAADAGSNFSICKALCEYMNGKIEIRNDYSKGSGFSIVLPQIVGNEKVSYSEAM